MRYPFEDAGGLSEQKGVCAGVATIHRILAGAMDITSLTRLESPKSVRPLILYVGDDQSVFDGLLERLLSSGFLVRAVETMSAAWRSIVQVSPFAVIIDATQPRARWRPWELCRDLSECRRFLVVMVFGDGQEGAADRVKAFEHGANQCFQLGPGFQDDLAAYVEMQRSQVSAFPVAPQLRVGKGVCVRIAWETRQVVRGDCMVSLSPKEFALLQLLKNHSSRVVPEREIIRTLWKTSVCPASRANLKQVVKHLRSKIEVDPPHPQYLVNVRGLGYCLKVDLMNGSGVHNT